MERQIPTETLFFISENCPRAMAAYMTCHEYADETGCVWIDKQIVDEKSFSWTRFRNDIKSLARQNLLEWLDTNDGLSIVLAVDPYTKTELIYE